MDQGGTTATEAHEEECSLESTHAHSCASVLADCDARGDRRGERADGNIRIDDLGTGRPAELLSGAAVLRLRNRCLNNRGRRSRGAVRPLQRCLEAGPETVVSEPEEANLGEVGSQAA